MGRIRIATVIDASPDQVWDEMRHIDRHVAWMADAVAIRFTSAKHEGKGTSFECDTKIGPIKVTDIMEITEWKPGRAMGVRHSGVVTGTGRFKLKPVRRLGRSQPNGAQTKVTWEEQLTFPWWLGGRVGAVAGKPIMKAVWRHNLRALKAQVEE